MKEYQIIRDTSPLSLKTLNDQLMLLWNKVKNIDGRDIRQNAIEGKHIQSNTIEGQHIRSRAITADKLDVDELSAISANLGVVTAGLLYGVMIVGGTILTADVPNRIQLSGNSLSGYYNNVKRVEVTYNGVQFYTENGSRGGNIYAYSWGSLKIGSYDSINVTAPGGVDIYSETNVEVHAAGGYGGGYLDLRGRYVRIEGSSVTINGYTAWHAGNDGSGSGMDADLFDGKDSSYFQPASDERLKTNIQPITDALGKILQLRGVFFNWNERAKEVGAQRETLANREMGLIAQEVAQVVPEVVLDWIKTPDGETYKTVDTSRMVALVIEAIKELNTKIENTNQRLEELEGRIA